MNLNEVELIIIQVKLGEKEALNMKVYKNGTLCRRGCGGLPEIGISGMSFTGNSIVFDTLLKNVTQSVLDNPVNYQDEQITSPLEYILAFYGVSKNGNNDESADWTKTTGLRFLLDQNTKFRHQALSYIDGFSLEAASLTNPWYFDIIVNAVFGHKGNTLPEQTIITSPTTEKEKWENFETYIHQIQFSQRKWNINDFFKDKIFISSTGDKLKPVSKDLGISMKIEFLPAGTMEKSKPWWKVW